MKIYTEALPFWDDNLYILLRESLHMILLSDKL